MKRFIVKHLQFIGFILFDIMIASGSVYFLTTNDHSSLLYKIIEGIALAFGIIIFGVLTTDFVKRKFL